MFGHDHDVYNSVKFEQFCLLRSNSASLRPNKFSLGCNSGLLQVNARGFFCFGTYRMSTRLQLSLPNAQIYFESVLVGSNKVVPHECPVPASFYPSSHCSPFWRFLHFSCKCFHKSINFFRAKVFIFMGTP